MLKYALSSFARELKTKEFLERLALPPGNVADAVAIGLRRLSAPIRGAVPLSVRGLPDSLADGMLEDACRKVLRAAPERTAYVQLTGLKTSWVYRIFIRTASGEVHRMVYKNAVYSDEQVPALRDLPVAMGPPEYAVYRTVHEDPSHPFSQFLPRVYLAEEVEAGRHYRYLMEDLGTRFHTLHRTQATLRVAEVLPEMHRAFRRLRLDASSLLAYDVSFRDDLLRYARPAIGEYANASGSRTAADVLSAWDEITAACLETVEPNGMGRVPVHGDPNRTNVLFSANESRFIDWEWAGIGLPHMDLAAVVKSVPPEIEREAIVRFARSDTRWSIEEHERVYLGCKLERALIDTAFLAIQKMNAAGQGSIDLDPSLRRALKTTKELIDLPSS